MAAAEENDQSTHSAAGTGEGDGENDTDHLFGILQY